MAVQTAVTIVPEVEGDLQVFYLTLTAVSNGDTTDFSPYFSTLVGLDISPSTSAGTGYTISGTVITWQISTGSPNLLVRIAGH